MFETMNALIEQNAAALWVLPVLFLCATFDALRHEDSPRGVAARRGKKVSEIVSRRRDGAGDSAGQAEA